MQPGQDDDSDSTCEEMHPRSSLAKKSSITSSLTNSNQENDSLWMTATQFSQLLDKQEAANSSMELKTQAENHVSYLDSEALLPFAKLKQVNFSWENEQQKTLLNEFKTDQNRVSQSYILGRRAILKSIFDCFIFQTFWHIFGKYSTQIWKEIDK